MATSKSNPAAQPNVHAYETSKALANLYRQLDRNNDEQFQEFCQRPQSRINTPIWQAASQNELTIERDFSLRQFLWFIRPPETLEFLGMIEWLWPILRSNIQTSPVSQFLPVNELEKTWVEIRRFIKTDNHEPSKIIVTETGDLDSKNLMVGHRSAYYPLFTALVNYPDVKISSNRKLLPQYRNLQAYFAIREAALLKQQHEDKKDDSYHPYNFLLSSTTQSGLGKIAHVGRLMRSWGKALDTSAIGNQLKAALSLPTYDDFIHELQTHPPSGVDERFIEYFTEQRGFRKGGLLKSSPRGSRGKSAQGGMHWPYDLQSVTQECEVDSIDQVITTFAQPSDEEIESADKLGEDPFEDQLDEPQVDIVFHEGNTQAGLSFEHYTSYAQQLLASRHQRFWWDSYHWTHEDLAAFNAFLTKENTNAAKVLKVIMLIGVDLRMACNLHIRPEVSAKWLKGESGFPTEGLSEPRLMVAKTKDLKSKHISDKHYLWIYPIKMVAFGKTGNLQNHHEHASYLPFKDQSGLVKELMGLHTQKLTKAKPLFLDPQVLEQECLELLKKFNLQWEKNNTLGEKKPKLTIAQLQAFAHKERQRLGIDPLLLDHLDWHTPTPFRPSLHYYSHTLHQQIIPGKHLGLQYALSEHTGIFDKLGSYHLLPTKNLIIGANTLAQSSLIQNQIAQIKQKLSQKILKPNQNNIHQLVKTINLYSLYICLWFCFETSHRPHHIPYKPSKEIDPLHGLVLLLDKTQRDGSKARIAYVSGKLRLAIAQYEKDVQQIGLLLETLNPQFTLPENCPIQILGPSGEKRPILKTISAQIFDSTCFTKLIKQYFSEQIKPNFYRHYMVHQLYLAREQHNISDDEIKQWLGHWVHGTQPFHEFSANNPLHNIDKLAPVIDNIMQYLGFECVHVHLPRGYKA